jgi:hypothetical protein
MYILRVSIGERLFPHRRAQAGWGFLPVNPTPRCSRIEIDVDYTRNDVETDIFDI